jgi:hypothetical protein
MRRLSTLLLSTVLTLPLNAQRIQSPEEYFGHRIGADRKLVDWDGIVAYLELVARGSDRVNLKEVGKTTQGRPFILLEISSERNLASLDRYRALQRRLYFQDHLPGQHPDSVHTLEQRRELFEEHKAVVLVTCTIHSTEVGAAQMTLELVHDLATSSDPKVLKILENVIFLLVPSLNPDGQDMVVEWYHRYVNTEYEAGAMPWLYHHYVGHDNNRDMYMLTQQETRLIAQILYRDWFPSIWLDEHQMGPTGPRIFTMPATDPINPNVHPLIYRLAGFYGQAQAAALEAAGKIGIIYDYTYTNFWPGAMAWTGWWHNQVGMLTEVASVRIATPTFQQYARLGETPRGAAPGFQQLSQQRATDTLPPPRDTQFRTAYPRPWLGGWWRLRDIVEYELIATMALLEAAANTRRELVEKIYEINRTTILQFLGGERGAAATDGNRQQERPSQDESGGGYGALPAAIEKERARTGRVMPGFSGIAGTPYAILVDPRGRNPVDAAKMLRLLEQNGVIVERASAPFQAGGRTRPAGTYVIRLAQVFGPYAKEMLERQTYPEVRPSPQSPPRPPYDVTAWSLDLLMGVEAEFVERPFDAALEVVRNVPLPRGRVVGSGNVYLVDGTYNDGFAVVNQLWNQARRVRRAQVAFTAGADRHRFASGTWVIEGVGRARMEELANRYGLAIYASGTAPQASLVEVKRPRIALYQPWGSNMDEGWTRWVLEQFGFDYTTLHPQDIRAADPQASGDLEIPAEERALWPPHVAARAPAQVARRALRERFDVIVFADQSANSILRGSEAPSLPPLYRGGIGEGGLEALWRFVADGGAIVALGEATELFIERWPIPVKNAGRALGEEDLLIPGSIVRLEADPRHPLTWGVPEETHGFFIRNPFFSLTEGLPSQRVSVPLRYPNSDIRASGWVRGEEHLAGRAAAVEVEFEGGGRLSLLGIRVQHRGQTHATFKVLFNALVR